jgi:SAM-dependent methyltransferase
MAEAVLARSGSQALPAGTPLGRPATTCRVCGSGDLDRFLDLGHMPPADQFCHAEDLARPKIHFPLEVFICNACGFVQLGFVVSPEILYQDDYPYEASVTRAGRTHFHDLAASAVERFGLGANDLAVDIGSNVGVLLAAFKEFGVRVKGVDPAPNIAAIAREHGIPTLGAFFGPDAARVVVDRQGQATVVTATNVFAHVDDLDTFMTAVQALLAPGGTLIIEVPYFAKLLAGLEYDTIYHEHLSYIAVAPLVPFFSRFGMRIFDIEERDIHGGSIRLFVDRGEHPPETAVVDGFLAREREEGARDPARLRAFAAAVETNRQALIALVAGLRAAGKTLAAVSAPAKGMTLLNYCHLGRETFEYVTEKSQLKIGRFTPGGHIPVVGDEELTRTRPDYALLLAWNFAAEIMANLHDYARAGGEFIVPIPRPQIVGCTR